MQMAVPLRQRLPALSCAAALLFLAITACTAEEPIRIGFLGGTSGRVADMGTSGRDAVELVVEECNRSGGIEGRPVQLFIEDDRQDPESARQAVGRLIQNGVAAIIGPMTSDMAMAVIPLLDKAGVVAVSPTATTEALSGRDDSFFRVTSTTGVFAAQNARYHIRSGDMRRIVATYDLGNRFFCENWLEHFRNVFSSGGGTILATVGFRANDERSFLSIARELLAPKPDGILIVANSMDSALLCQQVRKIDGEVKITLADWGATERLLTLGGQAVEGVTVVQTFDRESPAPRYQDFRKVFMERYQREPGFPGVNACDAARTVLAALGARKPGENLKQTLLSLGPIEGLQSHFSFDAFGDVRRPHGSISVVRNRKFVVLE